MFKKNLFFIVLSSLFLSSLSYADSQSQNVSSTSHFNLFSDRKKTDNTFNNVSKDNYVIEKYKQYIFSKIQSYSRQFFMGKDFYLSKDSNVNNIDDNYGLVYWNSLSCETSKCADIYKAFNLFFNNTINLSSDFGKLLTEANYPISYFNISLDEKKNTFKQELYNSAISLTLKEMFNVKDYYSLLNQLIDDIVNQKVKLNNEESLKEWLRYNNVNVDKFLTILNSQSTINTSLFINKIFYSQPVLDFPMFIINNKYIIPSASLVNKNAIEISNLIEYIVLLSILDKYNYISEDVR